MNNKCKCAIKYLEVFIYCALWGLVSNAKVEGSVGTVDGEPHGGSSLSPDGHLQKIPTTSHWRGVPSRTVSIQNDDLGSVAFPGNSKEDIRQRRLSNRSVDIWKSCISSASAQRKYEQLKVYIHIWNKILTLSFVVLHKKSIFRQNRAVLAYD